MHKYNKQECEQLRQNLKQEYDTFKQDWIDRCLWVAPHLAKHMLGRTKGKRDNHHIVDTTHLTAHRAFVAGFMEGNTSTTRSWFQFAHPDKELNKYEPVTMWMQNLNDRCLSIGTSSNLYHAIATGYGVYGIVDTAVLYIDELKKGPHFNVLAPGTFYLMNDNTGTANVLVREFPMTVKTIVETYGTKKDGKWDWSIFSNRVKSLFEAGNYTAEVTVCEQVKPNGFFDNEQPEGGPNRKWVSITYEIMGYDSVVSYGMSPNMTSNEGGPDMDKFLRVSYRTRKPFIAFRNESANNFAYGETGPTTMALGSIKSLNKKALSKDVAIDMMLRPPMQGPANLRKSYVNTNPNSYTPLDSYQSAQGGVRPLFQVSPQIATLNEDIADQRNMVRSAYFEDLMLFLIQNQKTRTAAEVNAVLSEKQLVIGPMLQSLTYTLNNPLVDFLADYAMFEDPYVGPPPPELQGESLKTVFISVFAQAQRSADLPSADRYMQSLTNLGQINSAVLDKVNFDAYADLLADRLYLPAGLNKPQGEVDARREKNAQDMKRQQMMEQTIPAMAGARKDVATAQQIEQTPIEAQ